MDPGETQERCEKAVVYEHGQPLGEEHSDGHHIEGGNFFGRKDPW